MRNIDEIIESLLQPNTTRPWKMWSKEDTEYLINERKLNTSYAKIGASFPSGTIRSKNACMARYCNLIGNRPPKPKIIKPRPVVPRLIPDYAHERLITVYE